MITPKAALFHMPAEWENHEAVWLAWPSDISLWRENLAKAQKEFVALCQAIAPDEKINLLVTNEFKSDAEKALKGLPVSFFPIPFGDIWLRDIAPLFLKNSSGDLATVRFSFNGWGGKYNLKHDAEVAANISRATGLREFVFSDVLEGGAIEIDGEGTCLTSRQCLLNPNRNPKLKQNDVERFLGEALGVNKVLWVGDGLLNDHTDGHIDTIARFSKPGHVLCMKATTPNDPNRERLLAIQKDLEQMTDSRGRKLSVHLIPSPGEVLNEDGEVMPASYLNFYISNKSVIVPIYGTLFDAAAVKAISECFPERKTVGLMAKAILSGGGAFHCISQQQPSKNEYKS